MLKFVYRRTNVSEMLKQSKFDLPPELHKALKRRALDEERSMREIVSQALTEYLKTPIPINDRVLEKAS